LKNCETDGKFSGIWQILNCNWYHNHFGGDSNEFFGKNSVYRSVTGRLCYSEEKFYDIYSADESYSIKYSDLFLYDAIPKTVNW
jgi:hypothetical protein